ncbi:MAG: [FeFe] hydrogenase H-cluster maturation GTPase HydF [Ruminococcus sp.]|nr:[FeFe] hydrogenase H-cluster maturation GTPase HydF [Ruminococcus sp.]
MEQDFNQSTRGNRIHIGFFGRRNAGKSSLVNAITGQQLSIVSEIRGTTTDMVEKSMELLPIGPVVIVDTPGLDDHGMLGSKRVEQARRALSHTDLAVLVVDASVGILPEDTAFLSDLQKKNIPVLLAWNKSDIAAYPVPAFEPVVSVSTLSGEGITALKEQLGKLYQAQQRNQPARTIFGDMLSPDDLVIFVTPIDESAPKGRMILPQVQALREVLDQTAVCIFVQPKQLAGVLRVLRKPPKLVVTDSQAFAQVKEIVPSSIALTSFSILFAHYKGVLEQAVQAVKALETLPEHSHILIAEGCTHHRQCNDIGTVKLPRWIQAHTKKTFQFDFTSGNTFPTDLSPYHLIVHCGGCMLNQREMESRAKRAVEQAIPYINYGILIAYLNGILERSLSVFAR